jgi:hypothetical protein
MAAAVAAAPLHAGLAPFAAAVAGAPAAALVSWAPLVWRTQAWVQSWVDGIAHHTKGCLQHAPPAEP